MLRQILAGYTNADPAALRFVYGDYGKPALDGAAGPAFNLAHSHDQIVVAVAPAGPLGVDLEWVRPIPDAWAIAAHYFTLGELAELRSLPAAQFPAGFYAAWTRKEAFLKAVGSGLAVPLDAVEVSLRPGDPPALRRVPPDQAATPWHLYDLDLRPAYRAALVVAGPAVPAVRPWPGLAAAE
jgi:4'-phosphopantetheinyl transferase